ncbi:MAG: GNAT family N-acetyltransferase [Desulfobaccales bacterium]
MMMGKKVQLVHLEKEDLAKSQVWVNDPALKVLMLRVLPVTRMDQEKWLEDITRNPAKMVFAIKLLGTGEHIGNTGFYQIDWLHRRAEFWILLGERGSWGQGVGTEVVQLMLRFGFGDLNLHKIYLHVGSTNEKAISLYKKLNFAVDGMLREHYFLEGNYLDVLAMSILKKDYAG